MNPKTNKSKSKNKADSCAIRVSPQAKKSAEGLLQKANKKTRGRKIKMPELVALALEKVTDEDIQQLQRASWTRHDEMEVWRSIYSKKNGTLSKDDFLGVLMSPEWPEFMNQHKQEFETAII
jgi:DNA-binding FadR family transcriptional regulator